MMMATTHGAGPFQPAVSFNGRLWVAPTLYDREDDAHDHAVKTLGKALARAVEQLGRDAFSPTEIKR